MAKKVREIFITLKAKGTDEKTISVTLDHALKILRIHNTCWEIYDNRFIFENNDIKHRRSEGQDS